MRFLIIVFVLGFASSSFAQEWEVVPSGDPELVCLSPGGDAEPVCGRDPVYQGCIERPAAVFRKPTSGRKRWEALESAELFR